MMKEVMCIGRKRFGLNALKFGERYLIDTDSIRRISQFDGKWNVDVYSLEDKHYVTDWYLDCFVEIVGAECND